MQLDELVQGLRAFDYDKLSEEARRGSPFQDLLLLHALGVRRLDLPAPSSVCWFHGTRVERDATFDDGIFPLPQALERIWALLGRIARVWSSPDEWVSFRENMAGQGAAPYSRKLGSGLSNGPYAVLVRDILLRPLETCSHDFLLVPEIIEDICMSYQEMSGHDLRDAFVKATQPCVIKFVASEARNGAIAAALTYVHRRLRQEDLFLDCNTCFNGEGRPIPPKDILKIDSPEG